MFNGCYLINGLYMSSLAPLFVTPSLVRRLYNEKLHLFYLRVLSTGAYSSVMYAECLCSPCCCCVLSPLPCTSAMRCRAWFITWPVGLGVCVPLSADAGLGESGELGSESPSEEKYPLEDRRGRWNIDLVWNTPRPSRGEIVLVLHLDCESGSPPPLSSGWPNLRSPPLFVREVRVGAPAALTGVGSPPLSSVAVTVVKPSERFGGLLDEQSGTVSLDFHHSAQTAYSFRSLLHLELQLDKWQRTAASGLDLVSFFPSVI